MGLQRVGRKHQLWFSNNKPQAQLSPLMEGPDTDDQQVEGCKESPWEAIWTWVRTQMEKSVPGRPFLSKGIDLKLVLGVLGCPLAPIPLPGDPCYRFSVNNASIESCSAASYIVHQYLAATGCLKLERSVKSMFVSGTVRMVSCGTEGGFGGRAGAADGRFVVWQMSPAMWLVELAVAGCKVVAGANGRTVWRYLPWLGAHAARGPWRPLRRIIQGLDPKTTASMFKKARCLGEKRIGEEECFVLRVSADGTTVAERRWGPAEVVRHVMYGYFSQRSGLLVYIEDSHLTRVQALGSATLYWETTIGSSVEDYRDVDGLLIAQRGTSCATLFRFGDGSQNQTPIRMIEEWTIDDVAFNVPGLSLDCFIPPTEIVRTQTT